MIAGSWGFPRRAFLQKLSNASMDHVLSITRVAAEICLRLSCTCLEIASAK